MASILIQTLIDQIRTDSDLNNSQVYTDDQITSVISDTGSDLYDIFTKANQKYNISEFNFSLAGGIGLNSIPLPDDFQQGHSVDVNPDTAQPWTLRYLPNWLNRNSYSTPYQIFGTSTGPKAYAFIGSDLVVLPAINAQGVYRLYYTPIWTPFALTSTIDVESASIAIPCDGSVTGIGSGGVSEQGFGNPFLATDVGNTLTNIGAVNSDNNGTFNITSFLSTQEVGISGSHTSEAFPTSATVRLIRKASVTAEGVWTFYGTTSFNNPTIDVNVGDVMTVSGAANAGNNGSFIITAAATGGVTVTTAGAVGLVAENFAGQLTVTVQPVGTRSTLPLQMNPWVLYLKTMACITIRNKRGQDVSAFEQRLAVQKDRIEGILQERQEEPQQPPLTRGRGGMFGGMGWGD